MELGRLIKTLRAGLGLSQESLAQKLEISASYLCLLETGKREPSKDLLDRIADVFSVSREALIFLTTTAPNELKGEKAVKYKKLQESIASLLLFQAGRHFANN